MGCQTASSAAYTSERVRLGACDSANACSGRADLVLCEHQALPCRRRKSKSVCSGDVQCVCLQQSWGMLFERRRNTLQCLRSEQAAEKGPEASEAEGRG